MTIAAIVKVTRLQIVVMAAPEKLTTIVPEIKDI
jgi:hypothetical protein